MKTLYHHIINKVIIAAILLYTLVACDSKENAVHDLLNLREEVKEHCVEYTEKEWEDTYDRFRDVCERLEGMEFTEEERMEIYKIEGEIAGYAATVFAQGIADEIQIISGEINDFSKKMNSFSKGFKERFEETFQEPKIRNKYD